MTSLRTAFLDACKGMPVPHTPVWFMRQAGRSLPEYRALRGEGDILTAIQDPERVAELTAQPVRRHDVDAAILYSDIMVPAFATGFGVRIAQGKGPIVDQPFAGSADIARLRPLDPYSDTPYVIEAVKLLRDQLEVPLIGFAGAPFTVAAYLIEGGPSKNYAKAKSLMHSDPSTWHRLLDHLADMCIASLRSQIEAGVQAVQLFDSWAGNLSPSDYVNQVAPATSKVFAAISDLDVPRLHFGVGTGELLTAMSHTGPDVMGIDWRVPLDEARRRVGQRPVQGNLDPAICLAPWAVVSKCVDRVLAEAAGGPHIFNLGHGVLPETDPDTLTRIVEHVHNLPHPSTSR